MTTFVRSIIAKYKFERRSRPIEIPDHLHSLSQKLPENQVLRESKHNEREHCSVTQDEVGVTVDALLERGYGTAVPTLKAKSWIFSRMRGDNMVSFHLKPVRILPTQRCFSFTAKLV
jgi:hypothetical protein